MTRRRSWLVDTALLVLVFVAGSAVLLGAIFAIAEMVGMTCGWPR